MSATLDRGHFDNRASAFRIILAAQPAPLAQAVLFPSTSIEPNTEPPCDHPEVTRELEVAPQKPLAPLRVCVLQLGQNPRDKGRAPAGGWPARSAASAESRGRSRQSNSISQTVPSR